MTRSGFVGALSLVAVAFAPAPSVDGQPGSGAGLVHAVRVDERVLELETRDGAQRIRVAATATIFDDHGQPLALGAIGPGDAVVYHTAAGTVTRLDVARQFWAVPTPAK
jgi:hypothetical protein